MKTQSPGCPPARTIMLSGIALLCLVLGGCGINITPPSADSGSSESDGQSEGDTSLTSVDPGMSPGMSPGTTPGASSGTTPDMSSGTSPDMAAMYDNYSAGPDEATAAAYGGTGTDPALDPATAQYGQMQEGAPSADEALDSATAQYERMQAAEAGADPAAVAGPGGDALAAAMERQGAAARAAAEGANPAGYGEGGGGGRAGRFDEGTAPHVVMLMVEAIEAGDMETAARYISDDADDLLGRVRDGTATENQLNQLQSYFATMDPLSQRPRGRSITLVFNGALDKVLSFNVAREGREFVVESMTIRDAPSRRGR